MKLSELFEEIKQEHGWDLSTKQGRHKAASKARHPSNESRQQLVDLTMALTRCMDIVDQPHTIKIDGQSWSIKHSLACRDDMQNCKFNLAAPELVRELEGSWTGEFLLYFANDEEVDGMDSDWWLMLGDRVEEKTT